MSTYALRNVNHEKVKAFKESCRAHGLKPDDVLRRVIEQSHIVYDIHRDSTRLSCELRPAEGV
jgi:hypothetical protein